MKKNRKAVKVKIDGLGRKRTYLMPVIIRKASSGAFLVEEADGRYWLVHEDEKGTMSHGTVISRELYLQFISESKINHRKHVVKPRKFPEGSCPQCGGLILKREDAISHIGRNGLGDYFDLANVRTMDEWSLIDQRCTTPGCGWVK